MKDFQLRNDTSVDLQRYTAKTNGCYDDVKNAIISSNGSLFELEMRSEKSLILKKGFNLFQTIKSI